ncbi:DUF1624 domain-containing protein [Telluribacter sp. SYSU D00476]|uniref:DUF1624 domain-containing protein n=1 Tax=Telluribacter sp. SYSU D00476 TaxID=2811430 RepID=UPI001FF54F04|nr:heparan-alpha-glucosaminide N-acetyltransferase domain-containing protein [Telluribacter sp. SYSU D00476]
MTQTATLSSPPTQVLTRVGSIDVLRGLVMIIMALDHTRDFLHINGFYYDATDMATTTPPLFFTRWITHYCAPIFVFLAGTSAYLSGRKKTPRQLSSFLLTRGLWLIFLEITIINFTFWFNLTFSFLMLQVIWAIGFSMMVLGGMVFLPWRVVLAVGLVIIAGHNTLDAVSFPEGTTAHVVWALLHQQSFIRFSSGMTLGVLYPVLPWIGVLVTGYCFGRLYGSDYTMERRKRFLLVAGLAAVAGFILLRFLNVYGDPRPWEVQRNGLYTFMSFLNTTKYPPSLLYLLMTLGPGMLLLYAFEGRQYRWIDFVSVYGRVPLFYYVLHFLVIHLLSVAGMLLSGVSWSELEMQEGVPPEQGFSLGVVYIFWVGVVLFFYPLCRWYAGFKARQSSQVWSYL